MFYVDDFRVLHLAYLNQHRVASKRRFYQFVDWELNSRHPVSLSRKYAQTKKNDQVLALPDEFLYRVETNGFDLLGLVDTEVSKCYMDDYIVERFPRHPMKDLRKLDIWDEVFAETYHLEDPQRWVDKKTHSYLRKTARRKDSLMIRLLDKVLKKLY